MLINESEWNDKAPYVANKIPHGSAEPYHDTVRCLYHAPIGEYHEFRKEFYITSLCLVRQTTLSFLNYLKHLGNIYSIKGYMLLSRRERGTIRRKRDSFSPCGEPSDQLNATRLCVQAPTPRLVCCSHVCLTRE